MKKFKFILSAIAIATLCMTMLSSCFGWYDFFDDPYGPPPPHSGYYNHGPHRY